MPKISAPTVAEHRAAQRAALVRSAEETLLSSGLAAVTPRSVCEQAGLARSSFYDYFPSRDDLLVAIAIDALERWDAELEEALQGVAPGVAQLEEFVRATMRMTADGRHRLAGILRAADLSPSRLEDVMALHDVLLRPLKAVIAEFPELDQMRVSMIAQGALGAGMQLVEHGVADDVVAADIIRLLTRGIAA